MNIIDAQVDKLFNSLCSRVQSFADEKLEQVITSYKKQICDAILVMIGIMAMLLVFVAFSVYAIVQQNLVSHLIASLVCVAVALIHIRRSGTGLVIFERLVNLSALKVRVNELLSSQLQNIINQVRPSFITDYQIEKIASFSDWETEISQDDVSDDLMIVD